MAVRIKHRTLRPATRWLPLAALAVSLLTPALPAWAQATYSLPQLIELGRAQHPRLQAAREQINGAEAGVTTARALPNPEVEWMKGSQRARVAGAIAGNAQSLSLTQRLDLPSQRNARINAAAAGLNAEQAQFRATERSLIYDIKLSYFQVQRRQAELEAASQDLKTLADIRERVRVRVSTGEAPRFDTIRADAEYLNAEKLVQSTRLRVDQAKAMLRNSVGNALPAQFDLAAENAPLPDLPPLASLQREALERNADLVRNRAIITRAREQLSLERNLRKPSLALRAAVDEDPEVRSARVGVLVSIPIWDRRQGPVAEASAQVSRLQFEQEQIELELRQRLESATQQYDISRNQVAALESGIVRQAEAALNMAEAAYRFGERGILEYLDAQRVYRNARNELIAARYEVNAALIEIEKLHQE